MKKRVMATVLTTAMLLAMTGCGESTSGSQEQGNSSVTATESGVENSGATDSETKSSGAGEGTTQGSLDTVTIYPANASVPSGTVDGYKAKIFAEYGLQLEVWAFSDEKTNAILASGDLPDLMYVTYDNLQTMIKGGMVMKLDGLLDDIPTIADSSILQTAFNYVRKYKSADTGELYGIPIGTSKQVEDEDTGRNAIKVNWPVYYELGCPEIKDVWELIPLMKEMMEAKPVADDGTKTWGTLLNSGTDSVYWRSSELWYKWFGYEPDNMAYLIETDMINEEYHSILEEGRESLYYEGLKWYNTAYREGVLDPDSINNDRQTQNAKVGTSKAIMVPAGSTPGWTGYQPIYIEGQNIFAENWVTPYGRDCFLVINAKTSNLDACLRFVEAFSDQDVFFQVWNGTEEEGLWYIGEDGLVYPTEEGLKGAVDGANGGDTIFSNGEKQQLWCDDFIGDTTFARTYKGPEGFYEGSGGLRRARTMQGWSEVKEITNNGGERQQWKEQYGYDNFTQLLKAKDAYHLESAFTGVTNFCTKPDANMEIIINAIRETVVSASWNMVYAQSDEEFEAYWDQMIKDCTDLGAEEIIQWRLEDLEKALKLKEELEAE